MGRSKNRTNGLPLTGVVLLFLVSGAAGLVYEVIWIRELTLIFGKTVHAATAVLCAYMAGLALGSAAGGRLVDRLKTDPLRVYAVLEAAIGLWALLLPLVFKGVTALYVGLSGPFEELPATLSAARFILATLAMMPATALMGATLPALSRWAVRHETQVGSRLGLLYALNTLGGVTGTLVAGFVLLEALGMTGATLTAVAANLTVAAIAFGLSRRAGAAGPAPGAVTAPDRPVPEGSARAGEAGWRLPVVVAAVAVAGFGALVLEVTWTRTLLLVFGSTAYSFSAMLSVFLFGIGLGSLLMTPFADRLKRPWLVLGAMQGGIGVLVLASVHAIDRLPEIYLSLMASWGLTWQNDLQAKFLLSAGLMLLPTILSGAVWPVAVRLARPRRASLGTEVGRLYAANTVGAILGSLAGGFVVLPGLGMQMSMAAIGIGFVAFGAVLALLETGSLVRRATVALAVATLGGGLALTMEPWDRKLLTAGAYFMPKAYLDDAGRPVLAERLRETRLLFYREGVTTTPSVAILGDINKAFFNDGKIEGATALDGMRLQRLLGHLPLLLHPGEPQVALNIGLGSGITVGAMGVHPVPRIDCAEIEPAVVEAARFFDAENFGILDRPGLRMIYNDGRNHLMLTDQAYDVISSAPFAPLVGGASSLYSLEHFRLVRKRLAPGGMTAQFLPLYQLSPEDYLSILKTFATVFPDATAWFTGVETILIGSDAPQTFDFERLASRMRDPRVAQSLREIGLEDPMRLLSTYCFRVQEVLSELESIPLNTDDRPRIEFSAPRSHLVNTVKDNLPWLIAHSNSPEPFIRFPVSWPADDPRPGQLATRLRIEMSAQALTMEGRLQVLRGDLAGGIATLEQAVATDPADIYARDLTARNLVKLAEGAWERPQAAIASYRRALDLDPDNFLALYNLARYAWEAGDTTGAFEMTSRALTLAPQSPSLNYRMGLLLSDAGRPADAERFLRTALDIDPRYPEPLLVLGDIYRARGDVETAVTMYGRAIELGRSDPEAFAAMAQALLDAGRREEAAGFLGRALAIAPRDPEAFFARARLRVAEGQREAAASDLNAAVRDGGESYRQRALADPQLRPLLN